MSIEEQIQLQQYVRAHQATLGCAELKRRARLVKEANALVGKLTKRAKTFAPVDRKQYARSMRALFLAVERAGRREKAYYGA